MVETTSVSVSGPAFSLLLYENARTKYDQEGFLLGEIIEKKTNSITDNDEQVTKIDRIIKINSTIPCPKLNYFYDAAGRLDETKIKNILGNQRSNQVRVVAWYKYKHTSAFKMTIREKIVHKRLSQFLAPNHPELFTCCLLTTNSSADNSTHVYQQTFLRYIEPTYQMIPMHVVNLSDPNNSYKSIESTSGKFNELVKSLNIDRKHTLGLNIITQINDELQKRTEKVATELAIREKLYYDLQEEVKALEERVRNKEIDKQNESVDLDSAVTKIEKNDDITDFDNTTNKEIDKQNHIIDPLILENGSNTDDTDTKTEQTEVTVRSTTNRGRKKVNRQIATRSSSRSPIKQKH